MSADTEAAITGSAPVDSLDINFRVANRLRAAGIYRVCALCRCRASDLMKLRGFGVRSLLEVEAALLRVGRSLRAEKQQ
jgi:DNA-directed RNA polymerase alpha subunit